MPFLLFVFFLSIFPLYGSALSLSANMGDGLFAGEVPALNVVDIAPIDHVPEDEDVSAEASSIGVVIHSLEASDAADGTHGQSFEESVDDSQGEDSYPGDILNSLMSDESEGESPPHLPSARSGCSQD